MAERDELSFRADWLEEKVWDTLVSVLKQPALLAEKLEAHRVKLGARDVEIRSEVEHLTRQLTEAERQEHKLLDLYLDDRLSAPALKARLTEIQGRRASLEERLTRGKERIAHQEAEEARQDTIHRACRQALRGLSRLSDEGRQRLLLTLVDRIVIRPDDGLEIHGALPAAPPGPISPPRLGGGKLPTAEAFTAGNRADSSDDAYPSAQVGITHSGLSTRPAPPDPRPGRALTWSVRGVADAVVPARRGVLSADPAGPLAVHLPVDGGGVPE